MSGKQAQKKIRGRKRAQRPSVALPRQLGTVDPDQLWAMIVAAGASPALRHRWLSVAHLLAAALHSTGRGTRPIAAAKLPRLLRACREDSPQLTWMEDFVAADPRQRVLVRLGDDVVRLFPGNIERPVADVDRALLVADAVDDTLVAELGFGVRDLITASLRYTDHAIAVLAPAWPGRGLAEEPRVTLTDAEVAAAAELVSSGTPAVLSSHEAMARALNWATCDAAELRYEQGHPQSPFGRFLRVRRAGHADRPDWLPLAFLPEITGHGVVELARHAVRPLTEQRFARLGAAEVRRALWRFGDVVLGPGDEPEGVRVADDAVQWVLMCGGTKALLVQVVTALDAGALRFDGQSAAQAVVRDAAAAPNDPIGVPMAGGTLSLHPGTEVVPLLVVVTAAHVVAPARRGMMAVSMDDLRWIARTASADTDLFMFCRDMARPDLPDYHGWEAIDTWEWWRANGKSFFRGGLNPSFISIAPHAGDAEWNRSADFADIEQAMATLGLPALRDCDALDRQSSGAALAGWWDSPHSGAALPPTGAARGAVS
ncbi:hypothetical protein [Lentzea sp. HUAS12]|uniref:hypothetical protein n=1 Tax=Lentzea sp. HUAS12 TaxID=2951806 RepID=UPI0020A18F5D|nr:hypothetical protein [Lentzea sp. HUAS12]USX54103.1 hypothetical protein ND450_08385 [Lentzea sp. HUAS12]